MTSSKIFLNTLFLILFFSCNKSPTGYDGYYNYQFETGLAWTYEHLMKFQNYRPVDFNYSFHTDNPIITEWANIISEGQYIFNNGTKTFVLREKRQKYFDYAFTSYTYYISKPEALYRYAYKGMSTAVPKGLANLKYQFNGKYFNNTYSLIDYITGIVNLSLDSLYIEPSPRPVYKYPLTNGSSWNFVFIKNFMKIDKEVIGSEIINVPAGKFRVSVIKWHYKFYNQKLNEDISALEYVSDGGLIKRTFNIKNVAIIPLDDPDVIAGYIDIIQELNLISILRPYEK